MDNTPPDSLLLPFEETSSSRRSFLQLVGFGIAGAALSGCSQGPVKKVIPALSTPGGVVPGRTYWIATTCGGCEAGCGVLAKCRDGRPIKLEGNPDHPLSAGGLCPSGQGSVLSLYDSKRFDGPQRGGQAMTWNQADEEIGRTLEAIRARGGAVRLLTGTLHGPSTLAGIERFLGVFAGAEHVSYDGLSAAAILDAHESTHGRRALPRYSFERAHVIASFGADFLSTWISPVEFTAGYTAGRALDAEDPHMSRHIQLEARLSLTGSRADQRVRLAPWETATALAGLCAMLEVRAGVTPMLEGAAAEAPRHEVLEHLAEELWEARGHSLVVAGADDTGTQMLVNYANHLLGNYGETLRLDRPSNQRAGDDRQLSQLREELERGEVAALIVHGVNPLYDLPGGLNLDGLELFVSTAPLADETSSAAHWICPASHPLESWDDGQPAAGLFTLGQPTVPHLRSSRTLRESLARWSGDAREDRELVAEHWRTQIHPLFGGDDFQAFFDAALGAGFVELGGSGDGATFSATGIDAPAAASAPQGDSLALVLHADAAMLDGRNANNPWLHEMPDPVTKLAWDNCASLSPATAERLGLELGEVVSLAAADGGGAIELPVFIQPGQHDGAVAVALGYGRAGTDRFTDLGPEWLQGEPTVLPGETVGTDAGPLVSIEGGLRRLEGRAVSLSSTGRSIELADTQGFDFIDVPEHLAPPDKRTRDVVQVTTFDQWRADPHSSVHQHIPPPADLWPDDHPLQRRWGMSIDLTKCTGCSACTVACQSENNVPVVGRDEARRRRTMSWIRIDRYYQGEGDDLSVLHQPMMCQQCDHAPCEAVCPVLATVHSDEGLNQQIYNRCVGTRYCANTCPYKVRRFNWFNYNREDELQNHALNPDVTVRSRGVMEKCTFCVQRIQDAKFEAQRKGVELADGDIQPACMQSCPSKAITFGDLNDPQSAVAQKGDDPRAYGALEELNIQPSVRYLAVVKNREAQGEQNGH